MRTVRRVTDAQVKELRKWLNQEASLKKAAMKAGMDRKSARKYRDQAKLPSETRAPRTWRTRADPLAEVWPELAEMLEREPTLQAVTLLGWLQSAYPGEYSDSLRRTLERRVRDWKAKRGPAKEVYFAQVHEPGRLGSSDFTHMGSLDVTIAGQPFDHLLYHFVLTHSNWEYVSVCFSESFASMSEGFQNAVWALGGVPSRHRTDCMSLAVHADGQAEEFTAKYQALMGHYGVVAEATNPASAHENGDCEQSHRRFKEAVEQALLLRGSRDFPDRAAYEEFLRNLAAQRNSRRQAALAVELAALRGLPARRLETQERRRLRVRQGSTLQIGHNTYSVPARLIGESVEVRIGVEEIEVWYADSLVQRMPRLRGQNKHHIDYRHIISWLVRKPGAFARYVYREELYPTTTFRRAYDALKAQDRERADKDYLQVLYLAAQDGEAVVEAALQTLLSGAGPLTLRALRACLGQETPATVTVAVSVPLADLQQYDSLLTATNALTEGESSPVGGTEKEVTDGGPCWRGTDTMSSGIAPADDAYAARAGGPASDGGGVELCRLPAGVGPARVPAAAGEADRTSAQGLEAAAGEKLAGSGPEAVAGQGGATTACLVERRLPGSTRQRVGVWGAWLGENALHGGGGPGTGAFGAAAVVYDLQPAGAGPAGEQARLYTQSVPEASGAVGGGDPGRPGLCAAESGGDGGVVHVSGGALRAWQRGDHEQSGVLEMGADLQGPDDDRGSGGSAGASQRDRGAERAELPGRGSQALQAGRGIGSRWVVRVGSAAVALAALGLPPLRQPAPPTLTQVGKDNCR
jgi:transposase